MAEKKIRLGVIGGGLNSAVGKSHLISSCMDHCAEIVSGVFSRNSDHNLETANFINLDPKRLYNSIDQFISGEAGKVDLVLVLTPTDNHLTDLTKLLTNEFSVVCEKALVLNSIECEEVKKIYDPNKQFLAVTYNYSGYPFVREVKNMVEQGELGKIFHLEIYMPQEGYLRTDNLGRPGKVQDWRTKEQNNLPKVSLDLGTHVHQMIRFLTGQKIQNVFGITTSNGLFKNLIDDVCAIANLDDGTVCRLYYGKSFLGHQNGFGFKIYGDKKSVEWEQVNPDKIIINNSFGEKTELNRSSLSLNIANSKRYERFKSGHPAGFLEAFANYYMDIFNSFLKFKNGEDYYSPYVYGLDESELGLKFLEAISKSAKEKKMITIGRHLKELKNVA